MHRMDRAWLLALFPRLYREAAPFRRRFAFALAVSLALHAAAVFGVRAGLGTGNTGSGTFVINARLVSLQDIADPATLADASLPSVETAASDNTVARPRDAQAPAKVEGENKARRQASAAGALPLNFIQAGYYYLASKVHQPPVAIGDIDFQYSENSPLRDGMVQARVLINARGSVDDVIVEVSEPPGVFDAAAIKALLTGKFSSGLLHGLPVPTQIEVEVRYKDPGASALPGVNVSVKKNN